MISAYRSTSRTAAENIIKKTDFPLLKTGSLLLSLFLSIHMIDLYMVNFCFTVLHRFRLIELSLDNAFVLYTAYKVLERVYNVRTDVAAY